MLALLSLLLGTASPDVGVVEDPCSKLPPPPAIVTDYLARAAKAKAEGTSLPAPSAAGMAVYADWQRARLMADFAGLCRYRAANSDLPPATPGRIVFFGDSITEGWSSARPNFFTGDRINRGIGGQTTTQMIARFRADVIALKPSVVHILAGTNDIAGNTGPTSLEAIEGNLQSMVELARANGIRVMIGAVLPARRYDWRPEVKPQASIAALNVRLKSFAERNGIAFVDYYDALEDGAAGMAPAHAEDGVHPTAAGYALMEPLFEAALRALEQ